MNIKSIYRNSLLLIFLSLAACTSPQKKMNDQIGSLEKKLYADSAMVPDPIKAKELIGLYTTYAEKFPDDSSSGSYLFKAGDISSKINETSQAIDLFGKMIQKYPNHKNAPFALFLQGFIYENQVGDNVKARPYYEAFLKKYPDHPIAGDVAFSLENLGKTPEELIKQFENNNQPDSLVGVDTAKTAAQ